MTERYLQLRIIFKRARLVASYSPANSGPRSRALKIRSIRTVVSMGVEDQVMVIGQHAQAGCEILECTKRQGIVEHLAAFSDEGQRPHRVVERDVIADLFKIG